MDDKNLKVSPETQKFLDDLKKRYPHVNPRPYVPKQTMSERFEEWICDVPRAVVILCKILYQILNIGGFVFMIVGGIFSLVCAYSVWKGTAGIKGIIYIILYLLLMFIIKKVSFLLYRIIDAN